MLQEEQGNSYYALLQVPPWATAQQVRAAYREMSKLYHPDTTSLPQAIATAKFQELNEAYATLSNPQRRMAYDLKIGYSRQSVIQVPTDLNRPVSESRKYRSRSAYLDPTDRPLSPGEIFALFILGVTFVACLLLVVTIGVTRGDATLQTVSSPRAPSAIFQPFEQPDEAFPLPPTAPAIAPLFADPPSSVRASDAPALGEDSLNDVSDPDIVRLPEPPDQLIPGSDRADGIESSQTRLPSILLTKQKPLPDA